MFMYNDIAHTMLHSSTNNQRKTKKVMYEHEEKRGLRFGCPICREKPSHYNGRNNSFSARQNGEEFLWFQRRISRGFHWFNMGWTILNFSWHRSKRKCRPRKKLACISPNLSIFGRSCYILA